MANIKEKFKKKNKAAEPENMFKEAAKELMDGAKLAKKNLCGQIRLQRKRSLPVLLARPRPLLWRWA